MSVDTLSEEINLYIKIAATFTAQQLSQNTHTQAI